MQDSWSKQESLPAIKRRVNDAQKIFHSIITVAMVVLFASLFISSTFLYDYFNQSQASQLKEELSLVASNMDEEGVEYFDHFDSSMFRFTLVSADGEVLYDSQATASEMEIILSVKKLPKLLKVDTAAAWHSNG